VPYEFTATRRVEFSETDLAGIVHFSNFFKYMETVEHGFWRSLGGSVVMPQFDPPLGLPRVHASCDFRRPLRFEDVVEMRLRVTEKRARTLSIEPGPAEEVAVGKLTVVCVAKKPDGSLQAVPFPPELYAKIDIAPLEPGQPT
jgi:acyl-CoA thioester hydrolase